MVPGSNPNIPIVTRGQGVSKEQGAAARKAVVTLNYRK
jgi:hypothetical protein